MQDKFPDPYSGSRFDFGSGVRSITFSGTQRTAIMFFIPVPPFKNSSIEFATCHKSGDLLQVPPRFLFTLGLESIPSHDRLWNTASQYDAIICLFLFDCFVCRQCSVTVHIGSLYILPGRFILRIISSLHGCNP